MSEVMQEPEIGREVTAEDIRNLRDEIYEDIDKGDKNTYVKRMTEVQKRYQEFHAALKEKYGAEVNRYASFHILATSTPKPEEVVDRVDFEGEDSVFAKLKGIQKGIQDDLKKQLSTSGLDRVE